MSKAASKEITAPIIVLVSICLVASFLLAGVYQITEPIIKERSAAEADAARVAVLPSGSDFVEVKNVELVKGVNDVYKASNGAGIACSTDVKGMYSGLKLMIGVDSNGAISGINILSHQETAGIGTKVLDDPYLSKWLGATAGDEVDAIAGATYTSNGVRDAVKAALEQFALIK